MSEPNEEPVIRDKRRIDPQTGELRAQAAPPGGQSAAAEPAAPETVVPDPVVAELEQSLAERTADLQRLQAEYANYRRRVERDRVAVGEQALAGVLVALLPVLDDLGRARDHGELSGGVKSIADNLEAAVGKLGLTTFGEVGEAFDPAVHEALMHATSPDVTEPSVSAVLQPGYRLGQRVLRPARVAVAGPEGAAEAVDEHA